MGRPKKTEANEAVNPEVDEAPVEQTNPEVENPAEVEAPAETPEQPVKEVEAKEELPADVVNLMRLYPQYEELWITSQGFVHPGGSAKYLLGDAKLYKNIFYNK